jgi:rare lipoprotein A
MKNTVLFGMVLIIFMSFGCGSKKSSRGYRHSDELKNVDGYTQTGLASWYGDKEHGNLAASGERFSKYDYTAAHKSLPFGTIVRVTNLENGKDVVVNINDRGPFIRGRIIDLSYSSAKSIDLVRTGVAKVKVEVISSPSRRNENYFKPIYTVQVGSFSSKVNAMGLKDELSSSITRDVRIESIDIKGDMYYRVRVGMYSSKSKAESMKKKLRDYGYSGKVILE